MVAATGIVVDRPCRWRRHQQRPWRDERGASRVAGMSLPRERGHTNHKRVCRIPAEGSLTSTSIGFNEFNGLLSYG